MTAARSLAGLGLVILLAAFPPVAAAQEEGIAVGSPAPAVSVPDLDGKPVDLAQFLGKRPILLEYWATWCEVCAALLPRMRAAHAKFGRDVEFIGVNVAVNQSPERVRRYVASEKPPFRVLYDAKGVSTRAYGASTTSYIVIIDRRGKVAYTGSGKDQPFEAALAAVTAGPDVGSRAPDFRLPWATKDSIGAPDQAFELAKAAGKPVVLAFYPKDFTSGCTAELKTFTQQYGELFGPDVIVVGISADSLTTHQRFAASLGLPFKLLSDPDQAVARLYASDGPSGTPRRTVYVIDRQGQVAYRNMRFGALDPTAYAELKAAVQRARG